MKRIDRGILFMLISVVCYVLGDVLVKDKLSEYSSIQIVFFRNLFGIFFLCFSIKYSTLRIYGPDFILLIARGVLGVASLTTFYYLLANVELANAVIFLQSSTIFASIMVVFFFKEKLTTLQTISVLVGFAGIYLVTKPNLGLSKFELLGILLAVMSALSHVLIKRLKKNYSSESIVLSNLIIGIVLPISFYYFCKYAEISSQFSAMISYQQFDTSGLIFIGLLALFSTYGQLFKTTAYSLNKAGIIGTIGYLRIAFAIVIGMLLGDKALDTMTIIGIVLITLSAITISLNKKPVR